MRLKWKRPLLRCTQKGHSVFFLFDCKLQNEILCSFFLLHNFCNDGLITFACGREAFGRHGPALSECTAHSAGIQFVWPEGKSQWFASQKGLFSDVRYLLFLPEDRRGCIARPPNPEYTETISACPRKLNCLLVFYLILWRMNLQIMRKFIFERANNCAKSSPTDFRINV